MSLRRTVQRRDKYQSETMRWVPSWRIGLPGGGNSLFGQADIEKIMGEGIAE